MLCRFVKICWCMFLLKVWMVFIIFILLGMMLQWMLFLIVLKVSIVGCLDRLVCWLMMVCVVLIRLVVVMIGLILFYGVELCVWWLIILILKWFDVVINGFLCIVIWLVGMLENICSLNIVFGLKFVNRFFLSISVVLFFFGGGVFFLVGWKISIILLGRFLCIFISVLVILSSVVMWVLWLQVCIIFIVLLWQVLVVLEVNGKLVCLVIGSVFMFVCSVICGLGLVFLMIVIILWWVILVFGFRFIVCSCLVILVVVCFLWLDSFGCWWKLCCQLIILVFRWVVVVVIFGCLVGVVVVSVGQVSSRVDNSSDRWGIVDFYEG